jgi:hypothetical protein
MLADASLKMYICTQISPFQMCKSPNLATLLPSSLLPSVCNIINPLLVLHLANPFVSLSPTLLPSGGGGGGGASSLSLLKACIRRTHSEWQQQQQAGGTHGKRQRHPSVQERRHIQT